jgi:DNA-directed RNA polymerase subunit RPC12/RpoP
MAVENAICPYCGKQVGVTVPSGQKFLKVSTSTHFVSSGKHWQDSRCIHCKRKFYTLTQER